MKKYIFSLDSYDNPYKDDIFNTEEIHFNQYVKISQSEFGIGRDFSTLDARGELHLSTSIPNSNKYFFSLVIVKDLVLNTNSNYNVAISISDNFAILAFDNESYIGYIYNNNFVKVTSSSYPNGKKILDVFNSTKTYAHIMVSCDGGSIFYYVDGILIGHLNPIISLNLNNPICYLGNFATSNKDGRLGVLDEILFYGDFINKPDCEQIYASFERLIPYEASLIEGKFFFSGDGTSEGSLGGPITPNAISKYDELNIFLPEILRIDNFYGRPIYKILYFQNVSNKTIYEPRLSIIDDFSEIHVNVSILPKNTTAVQLADKYDSNDALNGYFFQLPNDLKIADFLNPTEYVGIVIKHFTHNYSLPNTIITQDINVGDRFCYVKYGEVDQFNVGEFVIIYNMHSDTTYTYEIKQIESIDIFRDSLTFTNSFSKPFLIGANLSLLYRSTLFIKYGV